MVPATYQTLPAFLTWQLRGHLCDTFSGPKGVHYRGSTVL